VAIVVNKVALGQFFFQYFGFPCQFLFHQFFHNHHNLSSEAGTIGQEVATVPKAPLHEFKKKIELSDFRKCLAPWGY
jgi:hypothetical protein